MDEEGNLGYYLYDEATGEEKMFSVVEEERLFRTPVKISEVLGKGLKIPNKRKKQLFEEISKNRVLTGSPTKRQYRKITQSGVTPNKHALSTGVGGPITKSNDLLLNFEPSIPTNHSINIKGINEHVNFTSPKEIMKIIHNDPGKGNYTRFRVHLD